jgi:maltose/moltooligosaccharide transporter
MAYECCLPLCAEADQSGIVSLAIGEGFMDMMRAGVAANAVTPMKPRLSLMRILEMNLGFLGLQFSFGLQQSNMAPIYSFLGADEASLPILQLAGPVTGLLIQPIIGALSDKTASRWGRRTPYFLVGAIICTLGLLFMPFSSSLLMAASLLWILDAGNNITMEPYRAFVSDRLNADQHEVGFLTQSAFTGLAQTLSYIAPSFLVYVIGMDKDAVDSHNIPYITRVAFMIGAVLSITTILWSVLRVPELPLTEDQRREIAATKKTVGAMFSDIWNAIREMPPTMRGLAVMCLFQWYGMFCYWSYVVASISRSVYGTSDATTVGYRDAVLTNGQMGAFYNFIAFIAAFSMVPLTKKYGAKHMHAICLTAAGIGMIVLPHIQDKIWLFVPAIGVGLGWGSIMGNPYIMLASSIPPARTGIYMGIFNMFIVIPMLLNSLTVKFYYKSLLNGDARNMLILGGALLLCAAIAVMFVTPAPEKN